MKVTQVDWGRRRSLSPVQPMEPPMQRVLPQPGSAAQPGVPV